MDSRDSYSVERYRRHATAWIILADEFHALPETRTEGTRWIAHRISHYEEKDIPVDFGKILTSENIDDYIWKGYGNHQNDN